MPSRLDKQLDALASDLLALDDDEAREELDAVEAQIAALSERAGRLRWALQLKGMWTQEVVVGTPSGKSVVVHPPGSPNGRPPKTRDAIIKFFRDQPSENFDVKAVRSHLRGLGVQVGSEAVRQALRRLVKDQILIRPADGRYQSAQQPAAVRAFEE